MADWSVEPAPAPPAAPEPAPAEPVAAERSPIEALPEILEALFLEQPALTKALFDELNRADTGPLGTLFGSPSTSGVALPLLGFGHGSALSSVRAARHNELADKTGAGPGRAFATLALSQSRRDNQSRGYPRVTGPEALTMAETADRISAATGKPLRYVAITPEQRRQALIAHGIPAEIANAWDDQVNERLKSALESEVDLSTLSISNR